MGTYKIGGVPQHNTLGFLCWGRSLKIHIEMKRELFYNDVHCNKPTPQIRHSWQFNMNTSILGT
jgi:hypothetical protein